jgi:hypothetical protein
LRVEAGLQVGGVDLGQQLALRDALALAHGDAAHLAGHLGAHRRLREGRERAGDRDGARELAQLHDGDIGRRELQDEFGLLGRLLLPGRAHAEGDERARHQHEEEGGRGLGEAPAASGGSGAGGILFPEEHGGRPGVSRPGAGRGHAPWTAGRGGLDSGREREGRHYRTRG